MRGCRGVEPAPRPSLPGFRGKLSVHHLKVPHSPSIAKHLDLSWKRVHEGDTQICDFWRLGDRSPTSGFCPADPTDSVLDTCPRGNHSGSTAPYGVRCVLRAHDTDQFHLRASRPTGTSEGLPAGGHPRECLSRVPLRAKWPLSRVSPSPTSLGCCRASRTRPSTNCATINCETSRTSWGPFENG